MTNIFTNLNGRKQKACLLLLDEVYVKATLHDHGEAFGKAVNKSCRLGNTILTFLIVTLFGGTKLLCKILSVWEIVSKFIFDQTNLICNAIKNTCGNNVVIISVGNQANQDFVEKFDKIEPLVGITCLSKYQTSRTSSFA